MRLLLASANPDKAAEISAVLTAAVPGLDLAPRPADLADVDETGTTLLENARLKAAALAAATGEAAVADDTGLAVDALDGAPGVYSARFAGEDATYADNVAKLLRELDGVAPDRRTARFETVALVRWPDGREVAATGEVEGVITTAPRGEHGFGYDPIFEPLEGDGRTFAELLPVEKHALSHRGRAFRALAAELAKLS
ncbi:MAG TPA: RdgB/HAM1 family non-canonical purine NTP pyrophosphatase [Acidimicrobiia bacterium]|nr:RdgB/HAM1 family non-canonical purine NTP pyrophosphatase [Acidimicrobiia bacterium]